MDNETYAHPAAQAGRSLSVGDTPQQKPVTVDVTDSLAKLGSLADEVNSRLYSLRDRLLGPEMTASGGGSGMIEPKHDTSSFAGSARASIDYLRRTLSSIDRLSNEINNRL